MSPLSSVLGIVKLVLGWVPMLAAYTLGKRAVKAEQMEEDIETLEVRDEVEERNRSDTDLARRQRLLRWRESEDLSRVEARQTHYPGRGGDLPPAA